MLEASVRFTRAKKQSAHFPAFSSKKAVAVWRTRWPLVAGEIRKRLVDFFCN